MFGKSKVSQSMIDAVKAVIGETPEVEQVKQSKLLAEDGDCVTPAQAKKIADKEVGKHEKGMHKDAKPTFSDKLKSSIKEAKATGTEEMFTDNNLGEEGMSDKQMKKREKIVMSMKDKSADFKQRYGKNWKNVMYATATKQAMAEEVEQIDEISIETMKSAKQKLADRSVDAHMDDNKRAARDYAGRALSMSSKIKKKERLKSEEAKLEEGKMKAIDTDKKDTEYLSKGIGKDVADKAHLKHKPGTVKGTMTQIGRFLRGKPEIKEDIEVIQDKDGHKTTTDMLIGRVKGGKLNSFKNFKVNLVTSGEEELPKEMDQGTDTKEKQKISTNPGPVDIKLDDKLTGPTPYTHFSKDKQIRSEEVRGELKPIRSKESKAREQEVSEFKTKHKDGGLVQSEEIEAVEEKVIAGTPGWEKIKGSDEKGNIKDKSGAVHTPMSRAKDLARQSFKKIKNEMLGKISN